MKLMQLIREQNELTDFLQFLVKDGFKIKESGTEENPRIYANKNVRDLEHSFLFEKNINHPAGIYYVHLFSQIVVSSVSLADPKKNYQTTSARRVKFKKIKTIDYVNSLDEIKKIIDKHFKKVSKVQ